MSPHLLVQAADLLGVALALLLHVVHLDLHPGGGPPGRDAGVHHRDQVPQVLQHDHLPPAGGGVGETRAERQTHKSNSVLGFELLIDFCVCGLFEMTEYFVTS